MVDDEDIKELLTSLARTPAKLSSLLAELPTGSATNKQTPDEFSVIENICHLRDIEIEGYGVRIQRILKEANPLLPDIDGSRLAIERNYNHQSVSEALTSFTAARRQNLTLLNVAGHNDFERQGQLEGVGSVSLTKLLQMMNEHDEGHLDDLARLLRLARDYDA
jgi:hypothetical protein